MEVRIEALTRVEGEGALDIVFEKDQIKTLKLRIYEPPRYFEEILKGKSYSFIPDVTARICGICPVAYQMSGVQAIEDVFKVCLPTQIINLRKLMYYGEWIQSHSIHVFFLHLPDFYRVPSIVELAKIDKELVQSGLKIKEIGSKIIQSLGGRVSHPVSVSVGGFHSLPERLNITDKDVEDAIDVCYSLLGRLKNLEFPNFELKDALFVSLTSDDYPILNGDILTSEGEIIDKSEFKEYFKEYIVPYSTAKHAKTKKGQTYIVGPLARFNNNYAKLGSIANHYAQKLPLKVPELNPYKSILVRMVEIVHSLEKSLHILKNYTKPESSKVNYEVRAGTGFGVSEAPRGILWHSYELDTEGRILRADIVPPTSQNQDIMEISLRDKLNQLEKKEESFIREEAERLIRSFDPCISCATHFLKINIIY